MRGACCTLGVRGSIDHRDRHRMFILRIPSCSPQPANGRRVFVRHETFSGELILTPSSDAIRSRS